MKKKYTCIVCGKEIEFRKEFPHGSISLCNNKSCFDKFCLETQNSVPIVWVGADDFIEHELLTAEEIKGNEDYIIEAADEASQALWDGECFGETFSRILEDGAWRFEHDRILNMKKEELPLYLEHVHHEKNKALLIQRMKE